MFIQKGYEQTSIDEIIAKAHIAKGTYYYYFSSKEATLEEVINMMISDEVQRAAICRAMINHPDILSGDELTGALNSSTTREVSGIIDNINRKGTTVLLVTHDANVAVHADKVIYLEDGRIMDTINLGKYDEDSAESRDVEMKNWLKKMNF